MQYAFVATCADTDSAGTPFNCQETLGNGWVLNNDTAGEALVYDDVLDAIKCCVSLKICQLDMTYLARTSAMGQSGSGGVLLGHCCLASASNPEACAACCSVASSCIGSACMLWQAYLLIRLLSLMMLLIITGTCQKAVSIRR